VLSLGANLLVLPAFAERGDFRRTVALVAQGAYSTLGLLAANHHRRCHAGKMVSVNKGA
jgi:hypothetical protein